MLPVPDPLQKEAFGGEEVELKAVHLYRKALSDLKGKSLRKDEEPDGSDDGGEPTGGAGGRRRQPKGKKDKKEE